MNYTSTRESGLWKIQAWYSSLNNIYTAGRDFCGLVYVG